MNKKSKAKLLEALITKDEELVLKIVKKDQVFSILEVSADYTYFKDIATFGSGDLMKKALTLNPAIKVDLCWMAQAASVNNFDVLEVLFNYPQKKEFTDGDFFSVTESILSMQEDGDKKAKIFKHFTTVFPLEILRQISFSGRLVNNFLGALLIHGSFKAVQSYFSNNLSITNFEKVGALKYFMAVPVHKQKFLEFQNKMSFLLKDCSVPKNFLDENIYPVENKVLLGKILKIKEEDTLLKKHSHSKSIKVYKAIKL